MIDAHEQGPLMTTEEQTTTFGRGWNPQWPAEARQRYGDTPEWRQYAERSASRTTADWQAIVDSATAFDQALADAMWRPVSNQAAPTRTLSSYDTARCSLHTSRSLGRCRSLSAVCMKSIPHTPRITTESTPGLASWLRRIIDASARVHGIDPGHCDLAAGAKDYARGLSCRRLRAGGFWTFLDLVLHA